MQSNEFEWVLEDRTRMFACEWRPEPITKEHGVVAVVHGMGEHSGRYRMMAERFTAAGFIVLSFDQRGHGRTSGKRGDTPSYELLFDGIDRMLQLASECYADLPLFLYGHSMGGNVTLTYILRRKPKVTGAVVSSPWLRLSNSPPPLKVMIGRLLERIYPTFTDRRGQSAERLTSDPEMMNQISSDPLGHGHITGRFYFSTVRAGVWALAHANELSLPLLLMHGDNDQVTSFKASRQFAEAAGTLCTFQAWPGFRHELHHETGREQVFQSVIRWMEGMTPSLDDGNQEVRTDDPAHAGSPPTQ